MTPPDAEPTTKAERDDMLKRRGKHTDRLLYGPQTMMGRLIAQVEQLEADIATQVAFACPHIDKHELEKRIAEVEAESERLHIALNTAIQRFTELEQPHD